MAMTRKEFFLCLAKADETPRFRLDIFGDGWRSCYEIGVIAEARGFPPRDSKGTVIKFGQRSIVLAQFRERASVIADEENKAAMDRARKAIDKYQRWANEWAELNKRMEK